MVECKGVCAKKLVFARFWKLWVLRKCRETFPFLKSAFKLSRSERVKHRTLKVMKPQRAAVCEEVSNTCHSFTLPRIYQALTREHWSEGVAEVDSGGHKHWTKGKR
ncbi:hypothetical protein E2C01_018749 [Portunus trituberculatus]|uniref:Uncharacterized protein n=1 Tax=Portunus trituberculatus TaxID=210409 RepID=A0A5B7DW35_PORTR|nr:hypothetical protein [Portunus trituberculatus]